MFERNDIFETIKSSDDSGVKKYFNQVKKINDEFEKGLIDINKTMRNYPGGSIQFILDNLPEDTPAHNRNYFLKLKEKSDRLNVKNIKLDENQERIKRELSSLVSNSFNFISKNKNFYISQIEKYYELDKSQRFILNGALSPFGRKTVISYLPKFIKEHEGIASYLYESYDSISKLVENKDKEGIWEEVGVAVCNKYLNKKDAIEVATEEAVVEDLSSSTKESSKLEQDYKNKLEELDKKSKDLDSKKREMEEKMLALGALEEKYSNLLLELEEKSSKISDKEANKISGEMLMEYNPVDGSIEVPEAPITEEMVKEEPKVAIIEGFSATESAIINHMEKVLRHKKGTQNIWIDDETDKEHTFLSTVKISRNGKVITDKKEILDYYKESRNIEKI